MSPIVTASELLDLADTVMRLAKKADDAGQVHVDGRLKALIPNILDAASSAALRAVQDERALPVQGQEGAKR